MDQPSLQSKGYFEGF